MIAQIFNLTTGLVIPKGIAINKVNPEIETQLVTVEAKISTCSR